VNPSTQGFETISCYTFERGKKMLLPEVHGKHAQRALDSQSITRQDPSASAGSEAGAADLPDEGSIRLLADFFLLSAEGIQSGRTATSVTCPQI
jgi:hypothetical protein